MVAQINGNTVSALTSSVQGAQKESARFAKAADNLQKGFAQAANEVSDPVRATENRLEASTALASQEVPDVVSSSVDMLTSEIAYKANLEAFKAAADLEEETISILKRDI